MTALLLFWCCFLDAVLGQSSKQLRQSSVPESLDNFVFPEWTITNFDAGCSPGGCVLTFNMSSAATASEPGIAASCDINGDEIQWQKCSSTVGGTSAGEAVWAMPLDSVDTFEVSIQHRFANASLTPTRIYNVTGNMTVDFEKVSLPANLTVVGTSVSEAWWWLKVRSLEDASETGCVGQDHHVCEPVRNADGSIHGFLQLKTELRSVHIE